MALSATTGIGSAAAAAASSTATASGSSRGAIAGNFDQFLTLLTTQLKNQNPLDPLDTNQFTQQLVQFASVEQQLKSNETLSTLLTSVKASTASSAADLVGKQVTAEGRTARLADGRATWTLTPAKAAPQATITIKDAKGSVVATQTKALGAGAQDFAWDGRTSTGTRAPDGDYTITVTARDAAGQSVSVGSDVVGTVGAVDLSGESPILVVGSARVPLTGVKSIAQSR